MIARVWRGWTAPDDADRYERLLRTEILPDIAAQSGEGFRGAEVHRRPVGEEVAFMTLLRFVSMDVVRQFVGEDPRAAHVPPTARSLLRRFEDEVVHYEVVVDTRE
ncbi:antibiotic biosynthesis monooxygenase [Salinibacter altiplanensis]|uniref:antibiotic biosynthesis monooxygenase n=1 Tax=Salinibacter altiplanensis TaxID=1803181 RepID=UPI000C9F9A1B|nr:antibiotic biosynthesis monooxygenase [Salinibacter altiplanensis]